MKDFFDLWVLTRHSNLDVTILGQAIKATFARRGTALPTSTPVGLSDEFAADQTKQTQWRAFTARNQLRADRKSTRLNSSHSQISYAVFCLKKKKKKEYLSAD